MSNRVFRFLLNCCFVALQAMAPFIHAHAGAAHLHHADFLHMHQGAACEGAAGYALTADDHGTEVTVANGLPARTSLSGVADDTPQAAAMTLPGLDSTRCLGVNVSAPSEALPVRPGHALPFALAPPLA